MSEPGFLVLADLLAATEGVHSMRGLVRAVATSLASRLPIVRVELGSRHPLSIAELAGSEWRTISATTGAAATMLAPGIAIVARGRLPAVCADRAFQAALAQVIETATAHVRVIQRVATLSRRAHLKNRELQTDLERLGEPGPIVARSPAMRAARARAQLVARHVTTVLLTGESGSGKEVLAREIHRQSPRAHRPMLVVNCGAIPEALVESELFGHERGSFTGAERAHAGVFERAHRGTLLLDEVGELPLSAQVKLLRVLQERQVVRVGGDAPIDVDVRVIAATHRSLSAMVESGAFREDLYYRLDVFSIAVPALRDRRGDLGPLVAALTKELCGKLGLTTPAVSHSTMSRLEAHDWPGNVRELMNLLETALILGEGRTLELPDQFPRRSGRAGPVKGTGFDLAVRATIEDALRATHGKLYGHDGAAARLVLKPGTLQSKMRKLGINRTDFT